MANEEISFKLGLDAKGFQRGLTSLKSQMADFSREQAAAFKQAFSVGAAVAALGALGERMLALKRQAEDVGASTDFLQSLERLSVKFGGTAEDAGNAMVKLSEAIGKARLEGGPAEEKFTALGIALEDANGNALNTEQVFKAIATRYKETTDATQRAAIAFEFFGKTGRNINNILGEGADGIDAYTEKMKTLGLVASAANVNAVADAWANLKTNLSGIGANVVGSLARAVGFVSGLAGALSVVAGGGGLKASLRALRPDKDLGQQSQEITKAQLLKAEKLIKEESEKTAKIQELVAKLTEKRAEAAFDLLNDEEKIVELERQLVQLYKDANDPWGDLLKKAEASVKLAEKELDWKKLTKKVDEDRAKAAAEAADENLKAQAAQLEMMDSLVQRANRAKTRQADRTAFSLEELANANLRGISDPELRADAIKAKRVKFLERQRLDVMNSGRVGWKARAQSLLEQSDALRQSITNLRSEEREIQQAKDLAQIRQDIAEFNKNTNNGFKIRFGP